MRHPPHAHGFFRSFGAGGLGRRAGARVPVGEGRGAAEHIFQYAHSDEVPMSLIRIAVQMTVEKSTLKESLSEDEDSFSLFVSLLEQIMSKI